MKTINVDETGSVFYQWKLIDENRQPVPLASLDSLTLTLYDVGTDTIINSRDAMDILNTHNGTFASETGIGTMSFTPLDTVIVGTVADGDTEEHIALFEAIWNDGDSRRNWQVRMNVTAVHRV
jgi:hypothetical protein